MAAGADGPGPSRHTAVASIRAAFPDISPRPASQELWGLEMQRSLPSCVEWPVPQAFLCMAADTHHPLLS